MAATNREDGIALPLPNSSSAPADQVARKIKRLVKLSLLQEVPAKLEDALWRKSADDRHLTLTLTPLAFEVLGLDLPDTMKAAGDEKAADTDDAVVPANRPGPKKSLKPSTSGDRTKKAAKKKPARVAPKPEKASKRPQTSKTETLLTLLERSKGASLDEMMKASGWQPHSVRGFLSAIVKKKLRLKLLSEEDKGTRLYIGGSRGRRPEAQDGSQDFYQALRPVG
jgi:hypothetical protein